MTAPDPGPIDPPALPRLVEAPVIARRMGETFDEADTARVEDYIESVTAVVLDEGEPTWTATSAPPRVRVIVIDAVERRLHNPEQLVQRMIQNDMEQSAPALVGGWLTEDEAQTVRRLAGKSIGANEGATMTSTRTELAPERREMFGHPWPEDYEGRGWGGYGDAYGYGIDYYDDGFPA